MSKIDFSNIEDLYAQPLPVIQKCMEGNWKLLYSTGGIMGETIVDKHDSYMQITSERIIIGNKTNGVIIDSPITWEIVESFIRDPFGDRDAIIISYNIRTGTKSLIYADRLFPRQIKNDILIVWDFKHDGFDYYYAKY